MVISILAAGTWGTALAQILSKHNSVTVWARSPKTAEELRTARRHKNLPGIVLSESIRFTADLETAVRGADVVLLAVPSPAVRATSEDLKELISPGQIIGCVSKGLEAETLFTMSEVIDDVLQGSNPVVVLSGPTHAEEVVRELPTLIVSASEDLSAAVTVQNLFSGTCIRPYTNQDIKGVELCGAMKNIIALACGIAVGLGCGDNTKAAIMTRGMSEIRNLGLAMGCFEETFSGLAGMGDLIVTATSPHSRNNRAGQLIGGGMTPAEAVEKVGMVVEGINALPGAIRLAEKYRMELPIISAVNDIINNRVLPQEKLRNLLSRNLRSEMSKSMTELRFERDILHQHRLYKK